MRAHASGLVGRPSGGPPLSHHLLIHSDDALDGPLPKSNHAPIRVELEALKVEDFVRILTEPDASLCTQYGALLSTEGVTLKFDASGVSRIAEVAFHVTQRTENIAARRLHTVMERLLETVSFEAADQGGRQLTVDAAYVEAQLGSLVKDQDLSRFIL